MDIDPEEENIHAECSRRDKKSSDIISNFETLHFNEHARSK